MSHAFTALGHDRGQYFYLAGSGKQIVAITAREHQKLNLLRLAPIQYWEQTYPSKTGADWDAAANAVIQANHTRGVFDPGRIRGRGAWIDAGTVVLHVGDRLLVNGVSHALGDAPTSAIYEASLPIPAPMEAPLCAAEARAMLGLCAMPTWQRDTIDGYLLAGWCAIAPICGALDWRPHLWVTGGRGSGKSTIYTQIVEPVIGEIAVNPMGGSSSAGIRQLLGHDARPVLFDEAEGSSKRSSELMDEILVLMRGASSQTKARVVKGTAHGTAQDYRIRSCFGLFSIGLGATHAADRSRITVLSLTIDRDKSDTARVAHYDALKRCIAQTLTPTWTARFRARMVRLIPQIRASAEAFATAWAAKYGDRRVGDQVGTMLAGAWACSADTAMTVPGAHTWLEKHDWSDEHATADDRDESGCLAHLVQQRLTVDGNRAMRSVGQLIAVACGANLHDDKVSVKEAAHTLKLVGIIYDHASDMVRIAAQHSGTAGLLRETHWNRNWALTLRRVPGASTEGRQRFSGVPQRFVAVPLFAALGEE